MLLEFAQTSNHQGVFKVAGNKGLKQDHVISGELTHAVVEQATDCTVTRLVSVLNSSNQRQRNMEC
jgi:hypothetical protein